MGNHDDLPDLLLHPTNLRLVQKFVREWQRFVLQIQKNFSGSNTDGLFIMAVSNSFLSHFEKIPLLQIYDNLG